MKHLIVMSAVMSLLLGVASCGSRDRAALSEAWESENDFAHLFLCLKAEEDYSTAAYNFAKATEDITGFRPSHASAKEFLVGACDEWLEEN